MNEALRNYSTSNAFNISLPLPGIQALLLLELSGSAEFFATCRVNDLEVLGHGMLHTLIARGLVVVDESQALVEPKYSLTESGHLVRRLLKEAGFDPDWKVLADARI